MNNEALVLADVTCGDSEKVITFIQSKTKGLKGEEHEILDTFPILYVKNPGEDICKELKQFISEELTFENGINPALYLRKSHDRSTHPLQIRIYSVLDAFEE